MMGTVAETLKCSLKTILSGTTLVGMLFDKHTCVLHATQPFSRSSWSLSGSSSRWQSTRCSRLWLSGLSRQCLLYQSANVTETLFCLTPPHLCASKLRAISAGGVVTQYNDMSCRKASGENSGWDSSG